MERADDRDANAPPGSFVKLYATILRSSVWNEDKATRILWITMLADADADGYVRGSIGGLARLANLTRDEAVEGLRVLSAPDADSRTPDFDGRRIEEVEPGTWHILNFRRWREMRTPKQIADAERQRRHRSNASNERNGDDRNTDAAAADVTEAVTGVTVTPVTACSPSTSPSASSSALEGQEQENSTGREESAEAGSGPSPTEWIKERFGDAARWPLGLVRSAREPYAVAACLVAHLDGMHGPSYAPDVVALAAQEYAAESTSGRFNPRYFAGFVRSAQTTLDGKPGRVAARAEERFISAEDVEAERARREDAETTRMLVEFEATHPADYFHFRATAEASVPSRISGVFREPMVRAALVRLIRDHKRGDHA